MKIIIINDYQYVPAHNIDAVIIQQDDQKCLTVHTVGGYTLNTHYPDKDICRQDYERIFNELENN